MTLPHAFFRPRVTRRALLQASGVLIIGVTLPLKGRVAEAPPAEPPQANPNAFVRIAPDGTVTVLSKHIEFGQGPFTGLATLVADELDADWSKVRAEHSPSDPKIYANLAFGTIQGTGGSSAISNSYEQMRRAGAAARAMLVTAAARRWRVAESEITVRDGVVRHERSGRSEAFGALAADAAKLPVPQNPKLKSPGEFRLIGHDRSVRKLDSAAKADGTALFTIDIRVPDALTVLVARPPRFGAKLLQVTDAAARAVPGVVEVRRISNGVAVYGTNTWAAMKGREALQLRWDEFAAEKRGTEAMITDYRAAIDKGGGAIAGENGDVRAALASGDIVEAEYIFPYLAHAPMEPLDGFLSWSSDAAVARFGSQIPTVDQQALAKSLGLPLEKVRVEVVLAGGSFGRRAQATSHLAAELGEVAKALDGTPLARRPVKLVWTREDDLHGGYYRPLVVHRMRAKVEGQRIVAWSSSLATQSFIKGSFFDAMIQKGVDPTSVEGANKLPYDIPAFRCELHTMESPVSTLWWRSVGHSHTGYAVETFVDELLQLAGQDPVQGRLAMMSNAPRQAGVLRAVAKLANWNGPDVGNGRARGVAVVESFGSYVAQIAEVSRDEQGHPRVHKVWCAVDCGVAVNPDIVRAQMEGGIGYGLGHALYAEVPLVDGIPAVSNFTHYRSLRMQEMPAVEVVIVPSTEKPTGVGEPGVPPIAPAVGNALARLGAGRIRRLPFVRPVHT
jgi:isoquinoline 1-oxidoreductase beta subunit